MLRNMQRCTEEEARRVLQTDDWRVLLHELDAFLAIIYARGAHKQLWIFKIVGLRQNSNKGLRKIDVAINNCDQTTLLGRL